jgi:hypothetical protein
MIIINYDFDLFFLEKIVVVLKYFNLFLVKIFLFNKWTRFLIFFLIKKLKKLNKIYFMLLNTLMLTIELCRICDNVIK